MYFFYSVCFKPHANPTIINENFKEIHILTVGGILEFPILNDVLLRRVHTVNTLNMCIKLFCSENSAEKNDSYENLDNFPVCIKQELYLFYHSAYTG